MRDVTAKIDTLRIATAQAVLKAHPDTLRTIREGKVPKGDPLPVAKVAAIQAAKNATVLIPYCHPLPITFVGVEFELGEDTITSTCTVKCIYKTGVEMEALAGAAAAALNLYDMLKMIDEGMEILGIKLLSKQGGKSGFAKAERSIRASVLVVSDSVSAGKSEDRSGELIRSGLTALDVEVGTCTVVPDDEVEISRFVMAEAEAGVDLIVTTGGTGIGPRDVTPEAVRPLLDRELEGIGEALRSFGQERTPFSMLSRSLAGVLGKTVVVCLPGSPGAVEDGLTVLFPHILHALSVLEGACHRQPAGRSSPA